MKHLYVFFLLIISFICKTQTNTEALFPFYESHKTGFINGQGKVVIQPVFFNAGTFSEGLAPARVNGTFGYIDRSGSFVIAAQYDYATNFSEGFAIVYKNGKPFFINKKGEMISGISYDHLSPFHNGRALVKTANGAEGYISYTGKLLIDTVFMEIGNFVNGLAIVKSPDSTTKENGYINYSSGVIDTLGRFVIPPGIYTQIIDIDGLYFKVEIPPLANDTTGNLTQTGFTDRTGKLLFAKSHKNNSWIDGDVHCGLVKMNLYKYWLPREGFVSYTPERTYEGFVNLKGEPVINDTNYKYVEDFSCNRAFVQDEKRNTFLINTQGKRVVADTFENINTIRFQQGISFAAKHGKYGMIDTNGVFIIPPKYERIDAVGLVGNYFFPGSEFSIKEEDITLYGIEHKDGSTVLKPVMQEFDRFGFEDGILKCIIDGKYSLVNESGTIVWQEKEKDKQISGNLNSDLMNRGYFYAHSKPNKFDPGGFGSSHNTPRPIKRSSQFAPGILSLIVNPDTHDTFSKTYREMAVYVANSTRKKIQFNAQDSRLYMKVQALDLQGQWRDIEYLPSSWCGNSYHTLTLDPKKYWHFVTPVYEGDFKTRLRIELKYIDPSDTGEPDRERRVLMIYSNEYEGSINPGQFWRKDEYRPRGLMDPYND